VGMCEIAAAISKGVGRVGNGFIAFPKRFMHERDVCEVVATTDSPNQRPNHHRS
jgi:CTP-dependent riboflavin kinase